MKMMTRIVLCFVFSLSLASIASAQQGGKSKTFYTEGTFSSIKMLEGGDYGGMQVYLTDSDGQFYATVTIAEGVLLPPKLVEVKVQVEQRKIEFTLPEEGGSRAYTGIVTADGLRLTLAGSKGKSIFLKRKCY